MTKKQQRLVGFAVVLALLVGGGLVFTSIKPGNSIEAQGSPRARQLSALPTEGLHGAARVTGSFVGTIGYPMAGGPATLEELSDLSEFVIIGTTHSNVSSITSDGRSIVTLYSVRVTSVLKGRGPKPTDVVPVAVLGGKVRFADGTFAELHTTGFVRPVELRSWMFFLRRSPPGFVPDDSRGSTRVYVPAAGPLGMYDVSGGRSRFVRPAGFATSLLTHLMNRQRLTPDQFVDEVTRIVNGR